jgi:hypothetical protein
MFSDVLKLLELLLKVLGRSDDSKRKDVAKELLRIYLDLKAVVDRGRTILEVLRRTDTAVHRSVSISLLSRQHQAIQDVTEALTSGKIGELLALHAPSTSRGLLCLLTVKGNRVWSTLDQLVSDGAPLDPNVWVAELAARTLPPEDSPDNDFTYYTSSVVGVGEVLPSVRDTGWHDEPPELLFLANQSEIEKGREILDQIEAGSEQLRLFLVEKFRFEDVL